MSVTSEAENQAGDGSNISVSQREFCWFTSAAALAWQGGEGEPGQTLEWGGGAVGNLSLLSVTWFSRELALSSHNQAFSGEPSWDIL